MKSGWKHVTILAVVLAGPAFCPSAATPAHGLPESALVIVVGNTYAGVVADNGFAVGDGTLVVTCDHAVFEKSRSGRHRAPMLVSVFSPWLGEACGARVLMSDEERDLAVLEVPWPGHPALSLADANAIAAAQSARVASYYSVIRRIEDWDSPGSDTEVFQVDEERLPVAFVGVRKQEPQFVVLDGVGRLGPGWSGAPFLVPDTDTVIGCFAAISGTGRGSRTLRKEAKGAAVHHVVRALADRVAPGRLCRAPEPLESPRDAHEACSLALRALSSVRPGRYAAAVEPAQAFLKLRPNRPFGYRVLAKAHEELGHKGAARESYQRALELEPNSLDIQLYYAQFLGETGEPNEARRLLEPLWESDRSRAPVAIALVSLFGAQKDFSRCLEILEEAIKIHPRNAYLWQQIAACRMQLQGPSAAIEPTTRLVELLPERGPARGSLARLLEMTGAFDEAEKHFRKLPEIEPENPVVYFWLADFLSRHRPQAEEEALKIAEKALSLPAGAGLPRERIEEVIQRIRARTQPTVQE